MQRIKLWDILPQKKKSIQPMHVIQRVHPILHLALVHAPRHPSANARKVEGLLHLNLHPRCKTRKRQWRKMRHWQIVLDDDEYQVIEVPVDSRADLDMGWCAVAVAAVGYASASHNLDLWDVSLPG